MMEHKITFTTQELMVIRDSIYSITIRGVDAVLVGGVLNKVIGGIEKEQKSQDLKNPV